MGSDGVRAAAVEIDVGRDKVVRVGRRGSWQGHAWWFRWGLLL